MMTQTLFLPFLSMLIMALCQAEPEAWAFGTPWSQDSFPKCFNSQQSPIDFISSSAITPGVPTVTFNWDDRTEDIDGHVASDDHTVLLMSKNFTETIKVDNEVYIADMLNYHWGSDASQGSAHTIDGRKFSGEIEVLFRKEHVDVQKGVFVTDDLISVSVLLEESDEATSDDGLFSDFQTSFSEVSGIEYKYVEEIFTPAKLVLKRLLPSDGNKDFFMYTGRSVSPPCKFEMKRIVFKNPTKVSSKFMENLRRIERKDGTSMSNNFRETQPIVAGTTVYKPSD